jgi:hypothetical protein
LRGAVRERAASRPNACARGLVTPLALALGRSRSWAVAHESVVAGFARRASTPPPRAGAGGAGASAHKTPPTHTGSALCRPSQPADAWRLRPRSAGKLI